MPLPNCAARLVEQSRPAAESRGCGVAEAPLLDLRLRRDALVGDEGELEGPAVTGLGVDLDGVAVLIGDRLGVADRVPGAERVVALVHVRLDLAEPHLAGLVELRREDALVGVDLDPVVLGAGDALQGAAVGQLHDLAEGLHLAVPGLREVLQDGLHEHRRVTLGPDEQDGRVVGGGQDARRELGVVAAAEVAGVHVEEAAVVEPDAGAVVLHDGRHENHTILRTAHLAGLVEGAFGQDVRDGVGVVRGHGRVLDQEVPIHHVGLALQRDHVVGPVDPGGDFDVELRVQLHVPIDVDRLELVVEDGGLADADQVGGGDLVGLESRHEGGGGTREGQEGQTARHVRSLLENR